MTQLTHKRPIFHLLSPPDDVVKVGPLVDCCAASAGLASGVSFQTWSNARVDVRKARPDHKGRVKLRARQESHERAHLNAYIRSLRSGLEGPKGGSNPKDKWTTGKVTVPKRWEKYREHRMKLGLPVIGSLSLFTKLWKEHREIVEITATGHAKCDRFVQKPQTLARACIMCRCSMLHSMPLGVVTSLLKRRCGSDAPKKTM